MNSEEDAAYRLRMARKFLIEAEEDVGLSRWRSCVDNAQLATENAAKSIIAIVEPVQKTHEPAHRLQVLLETNAFEEDVAKDIEASLSNFRQLGFETHLLSDYGDEDSRRDPWELFGEDDAREALEMARRCVAVARQVFAWYFTEKEDAG